MSEIFRTRVAEYIDEAIAIVCKHEFEAVETDHGPGKWCPKCRSFQSDVWYSPQPIIAERAE